MNYFLFIVMITLMIATSNPVDGYSYGYNRMNNCYYLKEQNFNLRASLEEAETKNNALKTSNEQCDTKLQVVMSSYERLEMALQNIKADLKNSQQQLASNKDTITRLENEIQILKLSDEERIAHCGLINSIGDESITASSIALNDPRFGPQHSRLNSESGDGGWIAHPPYEGSWIELNLGEDEVVTAVATQGSWSYPDWVKTFSISYKSSTSSIFSDVKNQSGEKQIFNGNTDMNTVVINDFTQPLTAQFIRIHPLTWDDCPDLRFDVLSC